MFFIAHALLRGRKVDQNLHQTDTDTLLRRSVNPLDITPLSPVLHDGLIAISMIATLSLIATFSLLCFLTHRFICWQKYYKQSLSSNQYVVLIYNLLLVDFLQALAFVLCFHWVRNDAIRAGTASCFLQGIFLQAGDPGSGLFVLTIAAHTFLLVHSGRTIGHKWFVMGVLGMWGFLAILIIIPLASHGAEVFIPSGVWCWIDDKYESDRLYTHYLWIFLAEFGTVVLYAILFLQLRRQIAASSILATSQMESLKRLQRVVSYMVIYPLAYVVLSLPLAAGRMMSAQDKMLSTVYFIIAGAMMASSGLVDVLLYTLTRRSLVMNSEIRANHQYDNMASDSLSNRGKISRMMGISSVNAMTTTITASRMDPANNDIAGKYDNASGWNRRGRAPKEVYASDSPDRDTSTDNIIQKGVELTQLGKVYQETTIAITSEPAYNHPRRLDGDSAEDKNWGGV